MRSPLDHGALLTLAYRLEADAADGERDRVQATARRLFDALEQHLEAEQPDRERLPDRGTALAEHGHRLLDLLVELEQGADAADPSRCDRLAQRFLAHLTLQAEQERRSFASSVG